MEAICARNSIRRLIFDRAVFPWRYALELACGCADLENLHEYAPPAASADHHRRLQGTVWHRRYYDTFAQIVRPLYIQFLRTLGELLVFQAVPTLRVQYPGDVAVGEWHRDSDYGHGDGEINIWLPVTAARDTATVWVEGEPQNLDYGEMLAFDGANLLHGNKTNETGQTRVSIDFRVADANTFRPRSGNAVVSGRSFTIGPSYFEALQ